MKKADYQLIIFAAITAFVMFLSPSVKAEPNSTEPNQQVSEAAPTSTTCNADKPETAPHQKSAVSKENSQLQLVKEQLRGEFYKNSQDNLKFTLNVITGLISAFIVFALATMGYLVFKNKRDYKDAVAEAKEAAKNARDLEKEARGIMADIGNQAKTTLKEIDLKAQEKLESIDKLVTSKLDEIEKTSRKQKDESSKEFERQRKISELYNKAWKAKEAKDHETAADCFRQVVEELKEENDPIVYNNWGAALIYQVGSKKGPETEDLLKQAEEKCLKAESLKTGAGSYNLACIYALWGNEDKCKQWLKFGEKAGTLETRKYAMEDDDLKSVREKDWFKKLRWKGE